MRERAGVERKEIARSQPQTFRLTPFAPERLLARQSKSDIRNLTFMHKPISGARQDQNTYARVRGTVRLFFCSGNVRRSFKKRQAH